VLGSPSFIKTHATREAFVETNKRNAKEGYVFYTYLRTTK
jgi:hypothetical protein